MSYSEVCELRSELCKTDKALADVPREKIEQQLIEVGFDQELQKQLVGSLSGGWKMRLELARAMLYDADLLLLDEPTNHVCTTYLRAFRVNLTCVFRWTSSP